MKNIRIGNDILVTIKVTKDGVKEDLTGKQLKLIFHVGSIDIEITEYQVLSDTITFTFKGKEQKYKGAYFITLYQVEEQSQNIVDSYDMFNLVSRSTEIGTDDCINVTTESIQFGLDIKTGSQQVSNTDYNTLENKPSINDVELTGNKTADELNLQPKGNYISDDNYVHTDNNFTNEIKDKVDNLYNYDDTAIKKEINDLMLKVKELPTKDYVDNTVGNINIVLTQINGR